MFNISVLVSWWIAAHCTVLGWLVDSCTRHSAGLAGG